MKILHLNDISNVTDTLVMASKSTEHYLEVYKVALGDYYKTSKLDKINLLFNRMIEPFRLKKFYKENKFDILHIHYGYFGLLGILAGIPYYLHCHGSDVRENLKSPIFRGITRLSLRRAQKVFYSTPDLYEYIRDIREDAIFIPNPINTDDFKPENSSNQEQMKILVISKLDRTKGIEFIIDAITELERQFGSKYKFSILGFGNDATSYIEKLRSLSNVNILSKTPYNQMAQLINNHNLIIGQVKLGAIGMSELEAMSCNKPVITNFSYKEFYDVAPPILNASNSAEIIRFILNSNVQDNEYRDWIMENHDYMNIFNKLIANYRE